MIKQIGKISPIVHRCTKAEWWAQMVKIIVMAAAHNVAKLFLGLD